jgi:hypothetical protein
MAVKVLCRILATLGALAIAACQPVVVPISAVVTPQVPLATALFTPTPIEEGSMALPQNDVVAAAQADLAARLNMAADQVKTLEVREVTWPDASLGCPQAGMVYAQILQPGYLILLGVEKTVYPYHSSKAGPPFLCEQNAFSLPTPKIDRLVPPPDSDIN